MPNAIQQDRIDTLRRRHGHVRHRQLAPLGVGAVLIEVVDGAAVIHQERVLPDGRVTDPKPFLEKEVRGDA